MTDKPEGDKKPRYTPKPITVTNVGQAILDAGYEPPKQKNNRRRNNRPRSRPNRGQRPAQKAAQPEAGTTTPKPPVSAAEAMRRMAAKANVDQ